MSEQILIYFINFLFIMSIIKGTIRGGTSELISLVFFILSFMITVNIFENTFYRTLLSIVIFLGIYSFGLFFAYFYRSKSFFETTTGGIIGVIKFFAFLTVVTTIAILMEAVPIAYKRNCFVSIVYPTAKMIEIAILEKNKNLKIRT